jgi:hypothetical protein
MGFSMYHFYQNLFLTRVSKKRLVVHTENLWPPARQAWNFHLKDSETDSRPCCDYFVVVVSACEVHGSQGITQSLHKRILHKGILDRTGAIPYRAFSANCLRGRKIFYHLNSNRKGECRRRNQRIAGTSGRPLPVGKKA